MHMEQLKCFCGNVSSKAVPSIKLNKEGSTAATGLIQHAGKGAHVNILEFKKKKEKTFLFFLSFPFIFFPHTHSFIIVPVTSLPCANLGSHA